MTETSYILRVSAPDAVGILADVTTYLARHHLSLMENHDFGDPDTQQFFIWARFRAEAGFDPETFREGFAALAKRRDITWTMRREQDRPKALVLVSKGDHCLNDLLYRHRRQRLGADIVGIVSNHRAALWEAERHDIPFFHIPVTPDTKRESEAHLKQVIADRAADFIILARYMQVLSNELSSELRGRCINIHHSALPSFKGARPYHQAHARGVKLVGATAHYVTADLDEGPIIAQDVAPVDHRFSAERMVELGRDTEARVLARAVRAHSEGRVFLNGRRTVVFE